MENKTIKERLCYKMTNVSKINEFGVKLYQIQAIEDLPKLKVKKGQLGGWIESENNLIGSKVWLDKNSEVFGNAKITGKEYIKIRGSKIYGNSTIESHYFVKIINSEIVDCYLNVLHLELKCKKLKNYELNEPDTRCKVCKEKIEDHTIIC